MVDPPVLNVSPNLPPSLAATPRDFPGLLAFAAAGGRLPFPSILELWLEQITMERA